MKIALLAAASSVHTMRWANAFAGLGHTVDLITQHNALPGYDDRVRIHRLPHLMGMGYLLNGPRLAHLLRQLKPDVVNVHYATGYGGLARWARSWPVVLNVWGSDVFAFPMKSVMHKAWVIGNLRRADRIVSTSMVMAARVTDLLPGTAVEVVPFGVDMHRFSPAPKDPNGAMTIGTVKTLAATYGIDRLLEAFAILIRMPDMAELRLSIVGEGPDRAQLEGLARRLGIADRCTFQGSVPHDRVPGALHALDIYVALSRSESFGVAVVEASACGLPVVVSDAGGLPEVVWEGASGFIVPDGDPQVAAQRLAELARDPALRHRMGQEGRRRVQEHYDWSNCVDRMVRVLHHTAGK